MAFSLSDFVKQNLGKQIEVAGSSDAKFQCVDLVNAYIRDVLGLPIIEWTDAKDFIKNASMDYYPLANPLWFIPEPGDIVVWNGNVGQGHGHIAIVLNAGTQEFESFDQNWSSPFFCTKEVHTYVNVIGFLRKKTTDIVISNDTFIDASNWNYLRHKYDISDPKQIDDKIAEYEKKQNDLKENLVKTKGSYEALVEELRIKCKVLEEKTLNLEATMSTMLSSNKLDEVLIGEREKWEKENGQKVRDLRETNKKLALELDKIKAHWFYKYFWR